MGLDNFINAVLGLCDNRASALMFPLRGFVMHDHQIYGVSRPERNKSNKKILGLPEVHSLIDSARVKLPAVIQFFMYNLFSISVGGSMNKKDLDAAFNSVYHGGRAFTNGAGSDTHAVYPTKRNLNKPPMLLSPMVCGGALVRVIGEGRKFAEDVNGKKRILECWQIKTMNGSSPDLLVTKETNPELVFAATNSLRKKLPNGTSVVEPFWQLNGKDVHIPIMSKKTDYNWIPKYKVWLLQNGEPVPSPYNM
jgi:hypothetical protein